MVNKNLLPKVNSEWLLNGLPVIVEKSTQTDVFFWRKGGLDVLSPEYFLQAAIYQGDDYSLTGGK